MRVLLSTYGTRGDVEPLVALAVRLQELGAEVRMCAPPDEEFAERLAGLGVRLVPVGPPVRELMRGTTLPTAAELSRYRTEMVDTQFDVFPEAADGCDVLVAAGLAQIAARSVAEAAGIHYVYAGYSAVNLPSPHHAPPPRPGWPEPEVNDNRTLWELDARNVNAQFAEPLNSHRTSLGLPPVDNVRDHVLTDRPWLAADPVLGPWRETPGIDVTQTGAWYLPNEHPLPAALLTFLDAGAPPVYVGFGSLRPSQDIVRKTVEVIRARGQRVLVSRGWAELDLVDDGDDCFAVGEVNHQRLFARVAAVVHHGGAGTTVTAARAGVPQVVVPLQLADNPYWADRVADLGIGAAIDGQAPTTEAISVAFETALSPGARARAGALGGRIHTDGAEVAAGLLLDSLR
ncbi:glycosyltransferase [Streptomyces clavifer]|uniref:glycosyltransferase n=1 Tax=Streptomyces TaxID=1883 RepID=UPI0006F5481B|nr:MULTISPECIES: glycosyltransferase [unclassified Streptomyces]KQZ18732.1 glycosyl transferase [Streptomyces sp. Root55]MDX3061003.1 glycosyltransferase [Streptomyces sp. ND04-05B]